MATFLRTGLVLEEGREQGCRVARRGDPTRVRKGRHGLAEGLLDAGGGSGWWRGHGRTQPVGREQEPLLQLLKLELTPVGCQSLSLPSRQESEHAVVVAAGGRRILQDILQSLTRMPANPSLTPIWSRCKRSREKKSRAATSGRRQAPRMAAPSCLPRRVIGGPVLFLAFAVCVGVGVARHRLAWRPLLTAQRTPSKRVHSRQPGRPRASDRRSPPEPATCRRPSADGRWWTAERLPPREKPRNSLAKADGRWRSRARRAAGAQRP